MEITHTMHLAPARIRISTHAIICTRWPSCVPSSAPANDRVFARIHLKSECFEGFAAKQLKHTTFQTWKRSMSWFLPSLSLSLPFSALRHDFLCGKDRLIGHDTYAATFACGLGACTRIRQKSGRSPPAHSVGGILSIIVPHAIVRAKRASPD